MEFDEVIRKRTSTRKFSDKLMERNKLDNILEAGRLAPTAKNFQPIKIYIVESRQGLEQIDEISPCRYNAPTVLIVCGDKDRAFKKGNYSTYEMDACIVATHMMLEATNQGIDNIWIEYFDKELLIEKFYIPENLEPICLIPLGYKAEDCPANSLHEVRKDISEIVEYK